MVRVKFRVSGVYLKSAPHRDLLLIMAQLGLRLWLILVKICSIMTANGLSDVESIDMISQ